MISVWCMVQLSYLQFRVFSLEKNRLCTSCYYQLLQKITFVSCIKTVISTSKSQYFPLAMSKWGKMMFPPATTTSTLEWMSHVCVLNFIYAVIAWHSWSYLLGIDPQYPVSVSQDAGCSVSRHCVALPEIHSDIPSTVSKKSPVVTTATGAIWKYMIDLCVTNNNLPPWVFWYQLQCMMALVTYTHILLDKNGSSSLRWYQTKGNSQPYTMLIGQYCSPWCQRIRIAEITWAIKSFSNLSW